MQKGCGFAQNEITFLYAGATLVLGTSFISVGTESMDLGA